jgi:phosphate transport system substrate-binding protein
MVNGVAPTDQNVETGKYPIWSYEHIFTKGQAKPEVEQFIHFIATNKDALIKLGYLPISDMKVKETSR